MILCSKKEWKLYLILFKNYEIYRNIVFYKRIISDLCQYIIFSIYSLYYYLIINLRDLKNHYNVIILIFTSE